MFKFNDTGELYTLYLFMYILSASIMCVMLQHGSRLFKYYCTLISNNNIYIYIYCVCVVVFVLCRGLGGMREWRGRWLGWIGGNIILFVCLYGVEMGFSLGLSIDPCSPKAHHLNCR